MTVRRTALLILALLALAALAPHPIARAAPQDVSQAAVLGCPAIFSNDSLTVGVQGNGRVHLVWTIKKGKSQATTRQDVNFYPDLFPVLLDAPVSGQEGAVFAGLPTAFLVKYPLSNRLVRPAAYWKSNTLSYSERRSGNAPPGSPYYPHPRWRYTLYCDYTYEAVSLVAELRAPDGYPYPFQNDAGAMVTFPWFRREFTPGHVPAIQASPNVYDARLQNILAALALPCRFSRFLLGGSATAPQARRLCQEVLDAYLDQNASSVVLSERPADLPGRPYQPVYQAYPRHLVLRVGIVVRGTLRATREDCREQWDARRGWHEVCSTTRKAVSQDLVRYGEVNFPRRGGGLHDGSLNGFLPVRNRSRALAGLKQVGNLPIGAFAHDPRTGEALYNLSGLQFTGASPLLTIGYTGVLVP